MHRGVTGRVSIVTLAVILIIVSTTNADIKVLIIGNNQDVGTGGLAPMLEFLHTAGGKPGTLELRVESECHWSLQDHWLYGEARTALTENTWDYVVLQDIARRFDPSPASDAWLEANLRQWQAEIAEKAPTAQTIIYVGAATQDVIQQRQPHINAFYNRLADEMGLLVAPIGAAFRAGLAQDPDFRFFTEYGEMPQTLMGAYTRALILDAVIYNESPIGLPAPPYGLPGPESVAWMQQLAYDAVFVPEPGTASALLLAAVLAGLHRPTTHRGRH